MLWQSLQGTCPWRDDGLLKLQCCTRTAASPVFSCNGGMSSHVSSPSSSFSGPLALMQSTVTSCYAALQCWDMTHPPVQGTASAFSLGSSALLAQQPTCHACQQRIMDPDMLTDSEGTYWHNKCLKCCRCGAAFTDNAKVYTAEGRIYCEYDYYTNRPIANHTRCYKCYGVLLHGEPVQEAEYDRQWVFMHERCFVCDVCARPLRSGTNYIFYQRWMVCDNHFNSHDHSYFMHEHVRTMLDHCVATGTQPHQLSPPYNQGPYDPAATAAAVDPSAGSIEHYRRVPSTTSDVFEQMPELASTGYAAPVHATPTHMPHLQASPTSDMYRYHPYTPDVPPYWVQQGMHPGSMMGIGGRPVTTKARRSRTSFTDEQHRILTERFEEDQTPDSSDLERIGRECELPKRTVQIWFQNARARSKKTPQTSSIKKTTSETDKSAKSSTVFSASPETTPSTISTTESIPSEHGTHTSEVQHTRSHTGRPAGEGAATKGSRTPLSSVARLESDTTPMSAERSPLGASHATASQAADWKPVSHAGTGFEQIDYFNSPPFLAQDFGLLDESSESRTP
ncbi:LIM/homeobox protein Lhx2-like isoform X2 [Sycon ciliatum]|uniref:LIM/homeobox protein Lhx2-like isoform X2 n=1 Tax=Sycon ciliatum TaxID=27933 RepID=UPI0031F69AE4